LIADIKVLAVPISNYLAGGEGPHLAYSVEKLEKNGRMFFCSKPKHSELRTAFGM